VNRAAGMGGILPVYIGFGWSLSGENLGNVANFIRFRGATNPRPVCGVSCRGGEKPRGRNMLGAWQRPAERWQQCHRGVDSHRRYRTGSTNEDNSKRGGQIKIIFGWWRGVRDDGWRSKGDAKFMKVARKDSLEYCARTARERDPEDPFGNEERS